jgi:putative redox protein
MPTANITYSGGLRTKAVHIKSGNIIITDAPVDNHGKGEAFSPTDLLSTSLGACMLTIIGFAAEEHKFSIDGTTINITKIMAENPRRVAEIVLEFNFPKNNYSEKEKKIIDKCVRTCPVSQSLNTELKQTVIYNY